MTPNALHPGPNIKSRKNKIAAWAGGRLSQFSAREGVGPQPPKEGRASSPPSRPSPPPEKAPPPWKVLLGGGRAEGRACWAVQGLREQHNFKTPPQQQTPSHPRPPGASRTGCLSVPAHSQEGRPGFLPFHRWRTRPREVSCPACTPRTWPGGVEPAARGQDPPESGAMEFRAGPPFPISATPPLTPLHAACLPAPANRRELCPLLQSTPQRALIKRTSPTFIVSS